VRQIDAYTQPHEHQIPRHCLDRRAALLALSFREDPLAQIDDMIPWVPRSREPMPQTSSNVINALSCTG
jgi:hypothetical protein